MSPNLSQVFPNLPRCLQDPKNYTKLLLNVPKPRKCPQDPPKLSPSPAPGRFPGHAPCHKPRPFYGHAHRTIGALIGPLWPRPRRNRSRRPLLSITASASSDWGKLPLPTFPLVDAAAGLRPLRSPYLSSVPPSRASPLSIGFSPCHSSQTPPIHCLSSFPLATLFLLFY